MTLPGPGPVPAWGHDEGDFTLLPAVDLAGGRASQVVSGPDDPVLVALRWVVEGAGWVHLVDLDRAYHRGEQAELLARLVDLLPVPVQLSGGLEDRASAEAALATGAARVNLAASALAEPGWVADLLAEHGDRVAVGVDVDGDRVVARGSGLDLGAVDPVLDRLASALAGGPRPGAYVVADAARDGRRTGSDLGLFARMVDRLDAPVIASGGVAHLDDLLALRDRGVSGAVLGSALYHGSVDLPEALEALR